MNQLLFQFADALITRGDIGLTGPTSDKDVIKNALMPIYFWAGVLAVIIIIVAGFLYVTSSGNPQQITRAKNAIIGAVVGLIIVLVAFTLTNIVLGGIS
jgi:Ni,Fe-hydrogenase I cytochrome b subunit